MWSLLMQSKTQFINIQSVPKKCPRFFLKIATKPHLDEICWNLKCKFPGLFTFDILFYISQFTPFSSFWCALEKRHFQNVPETHGVIFIQYNTSRILYSFSFHMGFTYFWREFNAGSIATNLIVLWSIVWLQSAISRDWMEKKFWKLKKKIQNVRKLTLKWPKLLK